MVGDLSPGDFFVDRMHLKIEFLIGLLASAAFFFEVFFFAEVAGFFFGDLGGAFFSAFFSLPAAAFPVRWLDPYEMVWRQHPHQNQMEHCLIQPTAFCSG
jgi:hypothetical protein